MISFQGRAWNPCQPAEVDDLRELRAWNPRVPAEILELLRVSDGGDGDFHGSYSYLRFWSARWIVEANTGYEDFRTCPHLLGFADDGGPTYFAFDLRCQPPYPILAGVFGSTDNLEIVAENLSELFLRLEVRFEGFDR